MTSSVTTHIDGPVRVIGLDDSAVNALTADVIDDLIAALDEARDAGAVVITGRPGCLSAGLDRATMLGRDRAAVSATLHRVTALYHRLIEHPAPTVVACTGHAIAAGALLLLVADVRIGALTDSKIGFNEVPIGLPLNPLGVVAARARLLSTAVFPATVLGRVYDAEAALVVGFLDELTAPDSVRERAIASAARLARLDRRAFVRTRQAFWAPALADVERMLTLRPAGASRT